MAVRVAVFGDLLYDCFIWAERLPRVGETVTGYRNGFYAGGKGGNQAVVTARLGACTAMLGKVGQDERGRFLLDRYRENGVNVDGVVVDPGADTGTCCVHIDRAGNNAIIVAPLANCRITQAEVEAMAPAIRGAQVLLCQLQVNLDAALRALNIAREAGVITLLNPAPACRVPDGLFALADYVTPNETEAEFFTGVYREGLALEDWCRRAARQMHHLGARRLIITLGDKGAWYSDGKEAWLQPPFAIQPVDSTAAGDAFNGALALLLAQGAPVRAAMVYASAAGAITASRAGSMPSLPTRAEVEQFLRDRGVEER